MSGTRWGVALLMVAAVSGCYSTAGPVKWLPTAQETETSGYGGWFEPRFDSLPGGELLAVTEDSIIYLGADGVEAAPRALAVKGRVIGWNSEAGRLNMTGSIGALGTIANGYYLAFTAPAWWITTGMANKTQMRHPIVAISGSTTEQIAKFARYPQGWPVGLRRDQVRPKSREMPVSPSSHP